MLTAQRNRAFGLQSRGIIPVTLRRFFLKKESFAES